MALKYFALSFSTFSRLCSLQKCWEKIRSSFRRNCNCNSGNHGWHTTPQDVWIIPVWLQNPCQNRICNSSEFFFLKKSDRKHSWGLLMFGYSAGKSDAKSEEPVDWSFAVLELLREQGWDVKEMNDRYKRVIYWDSNLADPWKENKKLVKWSSSSSSSSSSLSSSSDHYSVHIV